MLDKRNAPDFKSAVWTGIVAVQSWVTWLRSWELWVNAAKVCTLHHHHPRWSKNEVGLLNHRPRHATHFKYTFASRVKTTSSFCYGIIALRMNVLTRRDCFQHSGGIEKHSALSQNVLIFSYFNMWGSFQVFLTVLRIGRYTSARAAARPLGRTLNCLNADVM